jgi:transcription elongation factor Elf1
MSNTFKCPMCIVEYSIPDLELYQVYNKEGDETEFNCKNCGVDMIITSVVLEWRFDTSVNRDPTKKRPTPGGE